MFKLNLGKREIGSKYSNKYLVLVDSEFESGLESDDKIVNMVELVPNSPKKAKK